MRQAKLRISEAGVEARFVERLVVGRGSEASRSGETTLSLDDSLISRRHLEIRQAAPGRFLIRDLSINGTWLDGRRLVPNVEAEVGDGATIELARRYTAVLSVEPEAGDGQKMATAIGSTTVGAVPELVDVTILVGDIAGYTVLSRRFSARDVTDNLARVFGRLEALIQSHGGSIKEYQGDAIFAYWEAQEGLEGEHARRACRCALDLEASVRVWANDETVWTLRDQFPLAMEWALATGEVAISTVGGMRPVGLAMVGDVVNYAFRLEKLAGGSRPEILASARTADLAADTFRFEPVPDALVGDHPEAKAAFSLEGLR